MVFSHHLASSWWHRQCNRTPALPSSSILPAHCSLRKHPVSKGNYRTAHSSSISVRVLQQNDPAKAASIRRLRLSGTLPCVAQLVCSLVCRSIAIGFFVSLGGTSFLSPSIAPAAANCWKIFLPKVFISVCFTIDCTELICSFGFLAHYSIA